MMRLPVWLVPGLIGLKGKTRARALAEYLLDGEALERKINSIDNEPDTIQFKLIELKIDLNYEYITNEEFKRKVVIVTYDESSIDYKKAMYDVDFEFGHITQSEYDKEIATTDKEPWVSAILDKDTESGQYYFECDWNDYWIAELRSKGYTGNADEELIDQWLSRLYATEIYEEVEFGTNAGVTRKETDDGKAEYT